MNMIRDSLFFMRTGAELARNINAEDVLIASFPRSGNTWVRNILADIIRQVSGENTGTHSWEQTDSIVPDIHRHDLTASMYPNGLTFRLIKTHFCFPSNAKKIIYIFREAGDALCSYFHFVKNLEGRNDIGTIDEFCLDVYPRWNEHVDSYIRAFESGSAQVLFVSYESMHRDPISQIVAMARFLELNVSTEMCRKAIENQSFDKLKIQSQQFYRKGKVGSANDELGRKALHHVTSETRTKYEVAELMSRSTHALFALKDYVNRKDPSYSTGHNCSDTRASEAGTVLHDAVEAATQLLEHGCVNTAFELAAAAKTARRPVPGLDFVRGKIFLQKGNPGAAIEALKEELRYFKGNNEAVELLNALHKASAKSDGNETIALFEAIAPYTMLGRERLSALYEMAKEVCLSDVPGNFVECGVAGGGSSALLAYVIKKYSKRPRKLFSFDSFEGMPEPSVEDVHAGVNAQSTGWGAGTCAAPEESLVEIARKLEVQDVIQIVKGYFNATLSVHRSRIQAIAFLHLDGDWYQSTKDILRNLYPLVVPNGVMQVDDYGYWDGCRQAVHEYEEEQGVTFVINHIDGTGVWIRKS